MSVKIATKEDDHDIRTIEAIRVGDRHRVVAALSPDQHDLIRAIVLEALEEFHREHCQKCGKRKPCYCEG